MSDRVQEAEPVMAGDPFAMSFGEPTTDRRAVVPTAAAANSATDKAMAEFVTAQRVAIKRDLNGILAEARHIAAAGGEKFFYHWETKNRDGTRGTVEGATIGCAMTAVNIYGNCSIEALPAQVTATHIIFMARFKDYEKGVTVTRTFQQRVKQDTGMRDAERQADIVYQIGQSKAMRNVVVAALKWLTDEMVTAAKGGLVHRIAKNPEAARKWLVETLADLAVPLLNAERIVARKAAAWTNHDMAKLFALVSSVKDGFSNAEDVFPDQGAETPVAGEAEDKVETTDKPKPARKTADKPKADAGGGDGAAPAKKLDPAKYPPNETLDQATARVAQDQREHGVAEGERDMRDEPPHDAETGELEFPA